jgi:hypothetical protein
MEASRYFRSRAGGDTKWVLPTITYDRRRIDDRGAPNCHKTVSKVYGKKVERNQQGRNGKQSCAKPHRPFPAMGGAHE